MNCLTGLFYRKNGFLLPSGTGREKGAGRNITGVLFRISCRETGDGGCRQMQYFMLCLAVFASLGLTFPAATVKTVKPPVYLRRFLESFFLCKDDG